VSAVAAHEADRGTGILEIVDAVAYLAAWITANPQTIYAWLVPRTWDGNSAFLSMLASYESTTALVCFWVTTTLANYAKYTSLMKCVRWTRWISATRPRN
jgi:hypothetical protein